MSNANVNIYNAMARDGGVAINGAATTVPSATTTNIVRFGVIRAINGSLVISAITSAIDYSSILPITLAQGENLYTPRCTTVTTTSGQGVAFYE